MKLNTSLLNDLDELITKQDLLNRKKIKRSYYSELVRNFTAKHMVHRTTVFSLMNRRKKGALRLTYNSLPNNIDDIINEICKAKGIK